MAQGNPNPGRSKIVIDAIRRFSHLPDQTIARHILYTHGDLFDNDLENIRSRVRYYTGKNGKLCRGKAHNHKDLFKSTPAKIPPTWRRTRKPYKLQQGVWLLISDIHIPFHEPLPLEAAIQAGHAEKVEGVFINGDMFDCAAVSFWPTAHRDFNRELEAVIDFLDFLRHEFPKQHIVYKPGNHEFRLPRYFVKEAPHLAESPVAAMETVLGFEQRNIEFLDYYQLVMGGKLPILHGHELQHIARAVNPARGLFLKTKSWAACSHCHSTSEHSTRNIRQELLTTWSFGCLSDLQPDYNPFGLDWNWGFGIINIEKDGNFEVVNRRILDSGKVV